ncbi:MAG: tripartite tricarboxylate transporter substrate-binding protein [Xanthobacteraceae bacterium]
MKPRILLALCGALALPATALAQDAVADFYKKNNTVRLIVASEAGGGYDAYSRLLARHMGKHIPGNPNIVVQNMPGAGGIVAANFVYNAAPKDGTVFGQVQRAVPFIQILGDPGPQYETAKFNWLGSLASEVTLCVSWHTSPVKTFADLRKTELIVGGSGPNDTEQVPAILNNILGAKYKIISGYPSSTAVTLAVERGEVNGICSSYSSLSTRNANWFKDKKINLLVQASTQRHPDLKDVPLALELATNPDDKALLEFNDARLAVGRPFMAPPGVPAERVKALRAAFMATVKDKDFLADAAREKRALDVVSGEDMQALLERVAKTPKALIERLADAQKYKGPTVVAKIESPKFEGAISEIQNEGRAIVLKLKDGKDFTAKISGSRTKLQIAGQKGDRGALKVGQACVVESPANGEEATLVDCK